MKGFEGYVTDSKMKENMEALSFSLISLYKYERFTAKC